MKSTSEQKLAFFRLEVSEIKNFRKKILKENFFYSSNAIRKLLILSKLAKKSKSLSFRHIFVILALLRIFRYLMIK